MRAPVCSARRAAPLLAVAVLASSLGGCGDSDATKVRKTLDQFSLATARGDYHAFCGLLSARLTGQLMGRGLTCEDAIATAFADVKDPTVRVSRIQVRGATATAQVHSSAANQPPSDDTMSLVKEHGDWRVATLSAAQPVPVPGRPGPAAARLLPAIK